MPLRFTTFREVVERLTLFSLRGANTFAKFLLTLYTARYLGLADLGIYGLLTAAATVGPALFGLGTIDWAMRQIVPLRTREALPLMATRLALPVMLHAVVQPLAWLVNAALGTPIPWHLVWLTGLILVLDNVASDAQDLLVARGRALNASTLAFLRGGLWPLLVVALGWFVPETRTLAFVLYGWLGGLALMLATLAVAVLLKGRWRVLRFDWRWLKSGIRASVPFYIKDISAAGSLYLDRVLVSIFLGLELTGVYTLFWSVTNFVHNLAAYGVVQAQLYKLVEAGASNDAGEFHAVERKLQMETLAWTLVLAIAASAAMPLLLQIVDRPLLQQNFSIYWLVLVASFARIGADAYGFVLLALRQDVAIAVVSVTGAIVSALLNLALVPTLGLTGAGLAYLGANVELLIVRYWLSRRGTRALSAAS